SLWSSGLQPLIVPLSLPPQPAVLTSHQLPHPSSPFSTPTGVCTELTNKLRELVQVDVAARNDGYDLARASPAGESSRNRTCGSTFDNNPIPLLHHFHGVRRFRQSDHQRSIQ